MKVLFYSLNAAIWVHSLPESRLVRELLLRGHEVVYVSCEKTLKVHCTSMSAFGVSPESPLQNKDDICALCGKNARILSEASGARQISLQGYVSDEDRQEISGLMETINPSNYLFFRALGVDVGRLAGYELFLKYKKMSKVLSAEEWEYYKVYLRNTLLSLFGFARIFENERPEVVVAYSPQYGVNGVCADFASLHGAKAYFIEGSSSNSERYSALRIWDWQLHGLVNPALQHWQNSAKVVSAKDVNRLAGHFRELFRAKSFAVYSSPMNGNTSIRSHFRIPKAAKVLLATLSSYDEAYAAWIIDRFPTRKVTSPVFSDQFEWIKWLIGAMRNRPDAFLVVRVHPRDFSNKREEGRSEQSFVWDKILDDLPKNVAVNWPQDDLSLYDFFREVDVVTTGWSATGVEALALGIPVVTYDSMLPSYPSEIHFTGGSVEEYADNIDRAIKGERSIELSTNALRWLAVSFSLGVVQIRRPIFLERWLRILVFKQLRLAVHRVLDVPVKSFDVRRAFGSKSDAARFIDLIENKRGSLFEVAKVGPVERENVSSAANKVYRILARAVGVRKLLTR